MSVFILYHLQSFGWRLQTGMCQTTVRGCTARCANTNCWPLCSCQLQLPDSTPPPSWSGPRSSERAPLFWTCTHSTVQDRRERGGCLCKPRCSSQRSASITAPPPSPPFLSQMKPWQVKWSHGPQESSWPRGSFFAGPASLRAVGLQSLSPQQCHLRLLLRWLFAGVCPRPPRAGQCHFWPMTAGQIWQVPTLSWIFWAPPKWKECPQHGLPHLDLPASCLAKETGGCESMAAFEIWNKVMSTTCVLGPSQNANNRSGWIHTSSTSYASTWTAFFWEPAMERRLSTAG